MKYAFEKIDFEIIEKNKHGYETWFTVKCIKCGRVHSVSYRNFLKRKNTHENICTKIVRRENKLKDFNADKQLYSIWLNIKNRCKPNYAKHHRYFDRGITNCWNSYIDFYDDMHIEYENHVKEYGRNETTIDRIDNDGPYSKDNCRFLTWKEQAGNKNRCIDFEAISPSGKIFHGKNLKKFCEDNDLNYSYFYHIIYDKIENPRKSCTHGWIIKSVETNG